MRGGVAGKKGSHVWLNQDLTNAAAAVAAAATYTTSSQVDQHTGEGRVEMEDLQRTGSCFTVLCYYIFKNSRGGYSSTSP